MVIFISYVHYVKYKYVRFLKIYIEFLEMKTTMSEMKIYCTRLTEDYFRRNYYWP